MALYFCWLGTYTDALVWPTLVGLLCSFANWKDGNFDPNQSKYTIVYTLYMSGWTVHFLERWGRKENELRFLWGNEAMTVVQKPRPQFKGVLRINFITNSEKLVADSAGVQFAKRLGSWLLILLVVLFTIFCATAAESLALLGRKPGRCTATDGNRRSRRRPGPRCGIEPAPCAAARRSTRSPARSQRPHTPRGRR